MRINNNNNNEHQHVLQLFTLPDGNIAFQTEGICTGREKADGEVGVSVPVIWWLQHLTGDSS